MIPEIVLSGSPSCRKAVPPPDGLSCVWAIPNLIIPGNVNLTLIFYCSFIHYRLIELAA